ncbi:MAG: CRISPR-associated endoribonuclease Cas6 [Bacteroidota bacterium]
MRLQLILTPNTEPVPFNHLYQLTGALHKWLGPNNTLHDATSLYSFGWLQGGKERNKGLHFPQGATWNLSFHDSDKARQLVRGLLDQPEVAYGMRVVEVREQPTPVFGELSSLYTDGSAILIRRKRADGSKEYLLWENPESDEVVTQSLKRKLAGAGYQGDDLNVRVSFDRSYPKARTRKITIKNIAHKGSECPVILEGTPEALHFAWTVGLGDLTGSGFGALR